MGDKKKKFVFVDWLEDDSVGVMPTSAIQKGQKVGIGEICVLRWGKGEFYDAKLLKFSGAFYAFCVASLCIFNFYIIVICQ